jgi:hypothetical protein
MFFLFVPTTALLLVGFGAVACFSFSFLAFSSSSLFLRQ